MTFTLLSSKEAKTFRKRIEERWGVVVPREHSFFKSTSGKIFAITKDASNIDISSLRLSSLGLYIADDTYGLRLSVEGAQLYCKDAKTNVIELSLEQKKMWMQGKDIIFEPVSPISPNVSDGWVVLRSEKAVLGCGLVKKKVLKNYYPKARRTP